MGNFSPQRHANPNNPMILVGSVNKNGLPSDFNVAIGVAASKRGRDRLLTGEHTVWALGEDVDVIKTGTQNEYTTKRGASYAAPQVAGLAAYFLKLPGLLWPQGRVSKTMKDYLVAKKRTGPRSPDGIGVAYNSIENVLEWCQPPAPGIKKLRRRYINSTGLSTYFTRVFRRQQKSKNREINTFENGHLTDQKYSNEVSWPDLYPGESSTRPQDHSKLEADRLSRKCSSVVNYLVASSQNQRGHPRQRAHHRHRPQQRASQTQQARTDPLQHSQ